MIYLLALHEQYQSDQDPVPINTTIVRSDSLLHPAIRQPDGGRMYRCLNEVQGRPGTRIVPVSTLTFELDGGSLWDQVADWEAVSEDVAALARNGGCDALRLGLPQVDAVLVANGPNSHPTIIEPHRRYTVGPAEREQVLQNLMGYLQQMEDEQPWWPGDGLALAPTEPARMPFKIGQ